MSMWVWLIIGLVAWMSMTVLAIAVCHSAKRGDVERSPFGPVQKWGYKDDRQ